jgi:hypothetical protein
MRFGQLPVTDQLDAFRGALERNDTLMTVLRQAVKLDAPEWYVAAGCVVQTVWNVVTDRPADAGIKDYDLCYFDDTDLSWGAEDAVSQAGAALFGDVPVEVRNEARVHVWYEDRFGVPCPPYTSTEHAIDCFPATTSCVGVRRDANNRWRIYAPHGFADVFNLVVRPNPVQAPREIYEAKARRWCAQWPELTVLPWQ